MCSGQRPEVQSYFNDININIFSHKNSILITKKQIITVKKILNYFSSVLRLQAVASSY